MDFSFLEMEFLFLNVPDTDVRSNHNFLILFINGIEFWIWWYQYIEFMDIDYLFMSFAIRDFLQQNNEKQSKLDRILKKINMAS